MGKKRYSNQEGPSLFPEFDSQTPEPKEKKKSSKPERKTKVAELSEKIAELKAENLELQQKAEKNAELQKSVSKLSAEKKKLQQEVSRLTAENSNLKSKADNLDALLNSNSKFSTTVVAKSIGWSAVKLNEYLHKKKVQYKQGETWVLYQEYANKGYIVIDWYDYGTQTIGNEKTRAHLYWTMKGVLFIHKLIQEEQKTSE